MIVLASASPRRRELLARAGLAFRVLPADVDETLAGRPAPEEAARRLALEKAQAVARALAPAPGPTWVVGADTVVALRDPDGGGWRLLAKAAGPEEAAAMLASLSGTRHAVVTGVAVVGLPAGGPWVDHERTWVTMRALAPEEIAAYVASGEWRDKAGAYAIQETADRFVTALEGGGFDNVVGLPVARTLALLARAGAPTPPGGACGPRDPGL